MAPRRERTRQWWDEIRDDYMPVTSVAVLDQLYGGDYPNKDRAIELLSNLPLVPVEPEIAEIVRTYIHPKVMPDDPVGDALHFGHIRRVNVMLGLYIPLLVTPLELLGGRDETEK